MFSFGRVEFSAWADLASLKEEEKAEAETANKLRARMLNDDLKIFFMAPKMIAEFYYLFKIECAKLYAFREICHLSCKRVMPPCPALMELLRAPMVKKGGTALKRPFVRVFFIF